MRKIISYERSTEMGATKYTAVLVDSAFIPVSAYAGAVYLNRHSGVKTYEAGIPDNAVTADFYRSNSGREEVTIYSNDSLGEKKTFESFQEADKWAKEYSSAQREKNFCPTCGKEL